VVPPKDTFTLLHLMLFFEVGFQIFVIVNDQLSLKGFIRPMN
jgi:hypothetical protein